ncbi:MAG: glycosyltransferase family 1 protein [Anaerolineae bacterium]|nr:glycosyltransferase family 1 protein [Anaerolineae bacterium]
MTRFLFTSLPLAGHIDWGGMLATAGELATRLGHVVAWASGPAIEPAIQRAGVEFLPLLHTGWTEPQPMPPNLAPDQRTAARQQRALDAWLNSDAVLAAAHELDRTAAGWQPDVIVVEPYAAAGALVAERRGVSLAVCGRPALALPANRPPGPAAARIAALCRQFGVAGTSWDLVGGQIRSPWLHLDFFARRWYADLPQLGPQTRFFGAGPAAGGSTTPRSKTILITLGSLFTDDPAFFRIAAGAVLAEGGQPLVVTGRRDVDSDAATILGLPADVEVTDWVNFDAVLPRVAGIVHHGGVGTTHAALRHGVPQVIVPHAGDQHAQAGRITPAGAGYGVRPSDFTPANARWFVRQLLASETLRAAASVWQAELAALGGPTAAADSLQEVTVTFRK